MRYTTRKKQSKKKTGTMTSLQEIIRWIVTVLQRIYSLLKPFFSSSPTIIEFDSGISAAMEYQIAEGGFSYIYSAHDTSSPHIKYALKRIICPDEETKVSCRSEAKIHRTLSNHDNIMKLLGVKFLDQGNNKSDGICFMLFPLITGGSLRDEINKRGLLDDDAMIQGNARHFTNSEILNIFLGLLKGVKSMHDAGYAHCDIKLENIMLDNSSSFYQDEETGGGTIKTPILMDFGSARQLVIKLTDRRTVLNLTEEASQNSTVSYRAPELFDGGCRHGLGETDIDGKIDVWSCGCVLYGMMYGTSPFEMEFRQDGSIRVSECTHLRVLSGKVPSPPKNKEANYGYSKELNDLVNWMLTVDRKERPNLDSVLERVASLSLSATDKMSSFDGISTNALI